MTQCMESQGRDAISRATSTYYAYLNFFSLTSKPKCHLLPRARKVDHSRTGKPLYYMAYCRFLRQSTNQPFCIATISFVYRFNFSVQCPRHKFATICERMGCRTGSSASNSSYIYSWICGKCLSS